MRKTSQDGTDSTSVTGGLDNEIKKPGTNINKIKKSSIKRKVPNFSHDSDDAIIEPLLQTDKENSLIANKSAKYLLNKSKTDCLHEKDTKALENPKVTTPVSIANNLSNNIISEKQSSSLISDTTPIYNHMNVNIFSGIDLKPEKTSTSNSILVEIDGCKTVGHGLSPLIFTTAKIHTDTKTKVLEPFQIPPMPILSTIEGNVVKAGVIYEDDKRYSISNTNKNDVTKNVANKSDFKLEPANFNDLSQVKVLPNETNPNSIQVKNQQNIKKESDAKDPFEKSAKPFSKDQKVSLITSNANSVDQKSVITKVTTTIATATCKANGVFTSTTTKQLIGIEDKSITSDKSNTDKSKVSDKEKINSNKIPQPYASSSKQNNKSIINTTKDDKAGTIKSFSTGSKKLQRQKNASIEDIKNIDDKDLNNITTNKNSTISDKTVSTPSDIKSDDAIIYKTSTPITTVTTKSTTPIVTSGLPSKSSNSSAINTPICKPSVNTGPAVPINTKSETKTKPAPTKIPEPSTKTSTKSPANSTAIVSPASSKTTTSTASKITKVTENKSSGKQDITSVSVLPPKTTKTELTTTSVASTLPLYIVSTSKTKIGSSSTPSISTVTKKSIDQKPITEVVNTNGKSGNVLMSTSQSNQSSSKPKITNVKLTKKDDRA